MLKGKIGLVGIGIYWIMMGCHHDVVVFEKLSGLWVVQTENNIITAERWQKISDDHWQGLGWTTQDGDTVFKETMAILATDSGWYYKAHPAIALRPTFFKIQSSSDSGFVAVNPRHDYPQTIQYHVGRNHLKIGIEGRPQFEEELTEEWTMERVGH